MANQDQLSMDDILSDKKPEPREVPKEQAVAKEPLEIPKLGDTPLPEKPKVERPISRKQAHRDVEQDAQGRVRDPETGQYAPKVATEQATEVVKPESAALAKPVAAPQHVPPEQEMTAKERAAFAKAAEETRKRQGVERERDEWRSKYQAVSPAAPATTEPAKTFWDDPDGRLKAFEQNLANREQQLILRISERMARSKYADFDEKVNIFTEMATANPMLGYQLRSSEDPAEFAYVTAKGHMEVQEAGGIPELRAKIEAETRVKMEAELKLKAEALAKERAALPPSLSEARSTGVNRPVWQGVPTMDQILKGD